MKIIKKLLGLVLLMNIFFAFCSSRPVKLAKMEEGESVSELLSETKPIVSRASMLDQPLIVLIENESKNVVATDANVIGFLVGLESQKYPILVSKTIIQPTFDTFIKNGLSENEWLLFDLPDSQFLLFMPAALRNFYQFNYNNLIEKTALLPSLDALKLFIKEKKYMPFSIENFERLFIKTQPEESEDPVSKWNMLFLGHSSRSATTFSGLASDALSSLLGWFNRSLAIGAVYFRSCYLGGKAALNLIEFEHLMGKESKKSETEKTSVQSNEPQLRDLNYILIIGNLLESVASSRYPTFKELVNNFFTNVAALQEKGGFQNLIKSIALFETGDLLKKGTIIPQVWFPHGYGFQVFQVDEKIKVLGKVAARVAEEEYKNNAAYYYVVNKEAVALIIYPKVMMAPLKLEGKSETAGEASRRSFIESKNHGMPLIYPSELYAYTKNKLFHTKIENELLAQKEYFPELNKYSTLFKSLDRIYPDFLSMIRGNSKQRFKEILLEDNQKNSGFIAKFILDSFIHPIGSRVSQFVFYIEKLIGINDLALLIESSYSAQLIKELEAETQSLGKISSTLVEKLKNLPSPLVPKEFLDSSMKPVTLEKVKIVTYAKGKLDLAWHIELTFVLDSKAWKFAFDEETWKPGSPLFYTIDKGEYEKSFNATMPKKEVVLAKGKKQKTISEVLKEKKIDISKRPLIKKGEIILPK